MNLVVVKKDAGGWYCGFISHGHAGYAEAGYDIACAGISALTFTAALALDKLTSLKLEVDQDYEKAVFECSWINDPSQLERSNVIIEMMLIGLHEIQKQYPGHLSISELEV